MPTVLRLKGFRFFFFSNELNEPAHIHVESDDKYAKFWLEPVQLAKSVGYSAREMSEIRDLVTARIGILRRKWDEYFGH
ncbi:MAG: DUF4160 domain-containing protein [Chloroflexi bacterium]|nr:DUF4160 domain-containing protein [Chloroflexota bacterium]